MQKRLPNGAEKYTKQNHRRRVWRKFVQVMACIVVFCTTYALILPAITMEKNVCGLEEHTHSEKCYRKVESESVPSLACTYESLGVHVHTADCYDSENNLQCALADYLVHTHDASCVDASGTLVCRIPERTEHIHTDECYLAVEPVTEPAHYHCESCYSVARGELICQKAETEGHTHGEACFTQGQLLCQLEEQEGHTHGEGCSETVLVCSLEVEPHVHGDECYTQLVCDIPEGEDHTHTEECSGTILVCDLTEQPHIHTDACYETHFICGLQETEGHTHGASCYEALLTCERSEEEPHFHTDSCYEQISTLVCTLEEGTSAEAPEATLELICREPAAQTHVHSDSCYITAAEQEPLTCTLPEDENHTHGATCYGTWELICGMEEHTHDLHCMNDPEADVETEAEWTASFADAELTGRWAADVVAIARTQLGYTESTRNYAVMPDNETIKGYTRYGAWYGEPYGDWCAMFVSFCLNYAGVDTMPLESNCPEWIQALTEVGLYHPAGEYIPRSGDVVFFDWNGDAVSDHVGIVTELTAATETETAKIKTIEGNIGDRVGSHDYAPEDTTILGYAALPEKPIDICGLQEHSHDDTCLDADGELICGMEEHTHDLSCNVLQEGEKFRVESVIEAIDAMPSAEEIDARVAEYQEQGDEDGEIAYLEQVFAQVQQVYRTYAALGETLQRYVTNADKLMELEYIWSAATLATSSTHTFYRINAYDGDGSQTHKTYAATMFIGGPPSKYTTAVFQWWWAIKVERQDGSLRVTDIWPLEGNGADKSAYQANETGFVLMFHDQDTGNFPANVAVGDYVTLNLSVPQDGAKTYAYSASGYGTITFSKEAPSYVITSEPTHVLQYQENGGRVAHTADFVDLNVYNYNYSVNDNWKANQYYPGFQWPGGAYIHYKSNGVDAYNGWINNDSQLNIGIPNWSTHRQKIDSINFGDSIVANHQYADSYDAYYNNDNGLYGKAVNATSVGKLYDYSAAQSVGKINWLWYDENVDDSTTNRPAGFTTTGKAVQQKLYNGTPITVDGFSLEYLFPFASTAGTTANGVTKLNTQSVDGLFQVNPVSGLYYYNSHQNHAQYSNNKFTLYDEIITPNFIMYPFGNFLPFNNINSQATQVGALNKVENGEGRMKTYVNNTLNNLNLQMVAKYFDDYQYSSRYQLSLMLQEYAESWYNAGLWNNLTSGQAITDFFAGSGDGPGVDPGFTQEQLDNIYNIDWDQPTDFFFGMDMSMNFLMPKDGLTGKDNGNNNMPWTTTEDGTFKRTGFPDGIPDYPMVFNFAGDDDVWVYIDGLLFLDLTGIHRHVGGTIDFQTGMVYYFGLDTGIGDTTNNTTTANYYYAETFEEIIRRSFTTSQSDQMNAMLAELRPVLNADGTQRYFEGDTSRPMKTFADYSTHTFKFFYMERGSGSSVCRMNFNFPILRENSISVAKELTHTSTEDILMVGNPDFSFQIMKANDDGTRTQEPYFKNNGANGAGEPYKVYNAYTNEFIRDGVTEEYGIFKIKAGERAEFSGFAENAGKYYIREILDNKFVDQYENVYVDGKVVTQYDNVWNLYQGPVSPVKDFSDGTTIFTFNNHIDAKKLSYLTITKMVNGVSSDVEKTLEFDMMVELNGALNSTEGWVPIPVGTPYTLYRTDVFMSNGEKVKIEDRPDRVVTTEGIVTVPGGATAEIDYMIPGTTYRVYETSGSAEGYSVGYGEFWGEEWITAYDDRVEGTIPVYNESNLATAHVCMTVTNALPSANVQFSVYKRMVNGDLDSNGHTVNFTAECITATAKDGSSVAALLGTGTQGAATIIDGQWTKAPFVIGYDYYKQFDGHVASDNWPVRLIYEITEVPSDDMEYTHDATKYYVAVDVNLKKILGSWNFTATLVTPVPVYANNAVPESGYATFENYLLDEIRLTKLLDGVSDANRDKEFTFTVRVADQNDAPLKNWALKVVYADETSDVTTDAEGKIEVILKQGESVRIRGIPLGGRWEVLENTSEGFEVTWSANNSSSISQTGMNYARGIFPAGGIELVCTNKPNYVYELPETGGAGTIPYTMAGLVLILFSMAYLMYRIKNRRRGAFESP